MHVDGWKIATVAIGALWALTMFLGQRTLAHYDEQDREHWRAIRELRAELRANEREDYALRSDVRLVNEQIGELVKDTGYLVNLWKERQP